VYKITLILKFYFKNIIILLSCLGFANAQNDLQVSQNETENLKPIYEYGFMGFSNLGIFNTDIKGAKGFENCCTGFNTGFGLGLTLGLTYKYYFTDFIAFNAKIGYLNQNATFYTSEFKPISLIVNNVEKFQDAEIEHSLKLDFNRVIVSPGISLKVWKVANLNFNYLMNVSVATGFHQEERLIVPNQGNFENNSRIRNTFSGSFKSNTLIHYLAIGINKAIPLNTNGSLILSPEVNLIIGMNNQVDYGVLKNNFFSFGFILAFRKLDDRIENPLEPK